MAWELFGWFQHLCSRKGRFNVWNHTLTDGDPRKTCAFHFSFHKIEVAQPDYIKRCATAFGVIRTLSRIDRIIIKLSMAETPLPCLSSRSGGKEYPWLFGWKSDLLDPLDLWYWWPWEDYSIAWCICSVDIVHISLVHDAMHPPSHRCISLRQAPAFRSIDCIVASNRIILNAAGFSMASKNILLWGYGSRNIEKNSVHAKCWNSDGPHGHLHLWAPSKSLCNAWRKSMLLPKVWLATVWYQNLRDFGAESHTQTRAIAFSVPQQDRTTLFPLYYSKVPPVDLAAMWIDPISLAARYRVACSSTPAKHFKSVAGVWNLAW